MCCNELKSNFQSSTQHFICFMCRNSDNSQEHSLLCAVKSAHMKTEHKVFLQSVKYADLFGSIEEQLRITEALTIIIQTRDKIKNAPRAGLPGLITGPRG